MSRVALRLLAAVLALATGAAAVVVAYLLLHATPGPQ
jgi:phage shock protein PspC (stress-responsive transcriptional regulator)